MSLFLYFFFEAEVGVAIGRFCCVFEGGAGKSRVFMWCFCGESMVDCVVIVERRHHVAERLKTCQEFEVYFRVRCGKGSEGDSGFGNGALKDSQWLRFFRRMVRMLSL